MNYMKRKNLKNNTELSESPSHPYNFFPPAATNFKPLRSQRGSALIIASIFMVVAATLIVGAARMVAISSKESRQQEIAVAEAGNVARAGLVDAINYFRRKGIVRAAGTTYSYPDQAFDPQNAVTAMDTLDATIGIVNQYPLDTTRQLYARYEIRKQQDPTLAATPGTLDPLAVHDVTGERSMDNYNLTGEGLIWQLTSIGYIYKQSDAGVSYNVHPNQVLGTTRMSTEVRKMGLTLPANAAAIATNMTNIVARSRGRIYGNGSFCCAAVVPGSPVTGGTSPNQGVFQGGFNSPVTIIEKFVFGGLPGPTEIRSLADFIGWQTQPITFQGSWRLAYYEGNVTYNPASPAPLNALNGSGVLYVNGNLTIADGTNSIWYGVIYATGAVTLGLGANINGSVIGRNGVVVGSATGTLGNANLYFVQEHVNTARSLVATYRESKAAIRNNPALPNL